MKFTFLVYLTEVQFGTQIKKNKSLFDILLNSFCINILLIRTICFVLLYVNLNKSSMFELKYLAFIFSFSERVQMG